MSEARDAVELGDFERALTSIAADDQSEEALELTAAAAYGAGELERALSALETLHTKHTGAGDREAAAFAAVRVALTLLCETGLLAPVRGWVARAERQAAGLPPGPVEALLAAVRACERILSGDPDGAVEPARRAVELGDQFGVDAARGLGRTMSARLAIHAGDVEGGLALLDELAVDLAMGGFDALTTGNVYCELICVAQWLGRPDRAREWTDVMERWRHGRAFGASHGRCRVHRAELLRVSGPADAAENEALVACAELRPWMRREFGWPLVELGNIRLLRGDLVGAEEVFLEAHERAWSPQPGLALLRLEQGDAEAARAMLQSEIDHPSDLPWKERPPFGDLQLLPILDAQVAVAAAMRDGATARTGADRLLGIAERYPSPGTAATAALADARAALLAADTTRAAREAQRAVVAWIDMGAPYDAAVARTVLAEALAAAGNASGAALEWKAAAAAFAEFGAPLREAAARGRLDEGTSAAPVGTGGRAADQARLVRRGDHWEFAFRDHTAVLADLKGIGYLARLLSEPGREVHVLDLVLVDVADEGLPVLDEEAKASYRRRLAEVEDDIAEAERNGDLARRELAARDRDYLVAELKSAVGLGGRDRTTGGTAERARGAVTRSLRYALGRLQEQQPDLAAHLSRTVRTGAFCSYQPDPLTPVEWRLET